MMCITTITTFLCNQLEAMDTQRKAAIMNGLKDLFNKNLRSYHIARPVHDTDEISLNKSTIFKKLKEEIESSEISIENIEKVARKYSCECSVFLIEFRNFISRDDSLLTESDLAILEALDQILTKIISNQMKRAIA